MVALSISAGGSFNLFTAEHKRSEVAVSETRATARETSR